MAEEALSARRPHFFAFFSADLSSEQLVLHFSFFYLFGSFCLASSVRVSALNFLIDL